MHINLIYIHIISKINYDNQAEFSNVKLLDVDKYCLFVSLYYETCLFFPTILSFIHLFGILFFLGFFPLLLTFKLRTTLANSMWNNLPSSTFNCSQKTKKKNV